MEAVRSPTRCRLCAGRTTRSRTPTTWTCGCCGRPRSMAWPHATRASSSAGCASPTAGSASLWSHLRSAFRHQESLLGPHGGYLTPGAGDWSDFSTAFLQMTESHLVSAQLAYVYPRMARSSPTCVATARSRGDCGRRGRGTWPSPGGSGPAAAGTRGATPATASSAGARSSANRSPGRSWRARHGAGRPRSWCATSVASSPGSARPRPREVPPGSGPRSPPPPPTRW